VLTRGWRRVGILCGVTVARKRDGAAGQLLGVLVLVAATLAAWWLWLGSDTRYEVDPVTGSTTGPYEPVQVVGCVLSLLVVAVAGGLLLRPWLVVVVMTVAFTAAWSVAAATRDESGLWVVGAALVAVGMAAGTAACAFGAGLARTAAGRRG
jgi:hypothetical protein